MGDLTLGVRTAIRTNIECVKPDLRADFGGWPLARALLEPARI